MLCGMNNNADSDFVGILQKQNSLSTDTQRDIVRVPVQKLFTTKINAFESSVVSKL